MMALTPDQEKMKEAALELVEWPECFKHDYYERKLAAFRAETSPADVYAILAQLEQVQGWLSVADELPEEGTGDVLCYGKCFLSQRPRIGIGERWGDMIIAELVNEVTHWKNLPPPPEAA